MPTNEHIEETKVGDDPFRYASGGIFKMRSDGTKDEIDPRIFHIVESWRKTKARLQEQYPTAKIKYSYKTKNFLIEFPLPSDYYQIKSISITS